MSNILRSEAFEREEMAHFKAICTVLRDRDVVLFIPDPDCPILWVQLDTACDVLQVPGGAVVRWMRDLREEHFAWDDHVLYSAVFSENIQ